MGLFDIFSSESDNAKSDSVKSDEELEVFIAEDAGETVTTERLRSVSDYLSEKPINDAEEVLGETGQELIQDQLEIKHILKITGTNHASAGGSPAMALFNKSWVKIIVPRSILPDANYKIRYRDLEKVNYVEGGWGTIPHFELHRPYKDPVKLVVKHSEMEDVEVQNIRYWLKDKVRELQY